MTVNPYDKLLHRASEALRRHGTETNRHGVVDEVKEEGGERKFRCTIGIKPDGSPWRTPWMSSQEHRSGGQRSQDEIKVGQNMSIQGSLRQATATPQAEAKHAPQPKHAPDVNGRSQSIGKKLRVAYHGGQDDQQQQGGAGGGGGGGAGGGGQQSQQKQKGEKEHYSAQWIAKEEEKLEKWQPQSGQAKSTTTGGSGGGGQSGSTQQAQQGQQGQQQQKEERAMQAVMHEKEGHTLVIGKGDDAVRAAVHPKGYAGRAGKDNHFVAEKDGDSFIKAKKNNYVSREDGENYVDKAWVIKKPKKDKVPNHDLA